MHDDDTPSSSALQHALALARLGVHIFRLSPSLKTPLPGVSWAAEATDNVGLLGAYWEQAPDANAGAACGELSGVTVQDIDCKPGKPSGWDYMARLPDHQRLIAGVPRVDTLTGGAHLWWAYEPRLGNRNLSRHGIDIQGTGSYVVTPGSRLDYRDEKTGFRYCGELQWTVEPAWALQSMGLPVWPRMPEPLVQHLLAGLGEEERGRGGAGAPLVAPLPAPHVQWTTWGVGGAVKAFMASSGTEEDAAKWGGDRSVAVQACAAALYRRKMNDEQVMAALKSSPAVWSVAMDPQHNGAGTEPRARAWLWTGMQKVRGLRNVTEEMFGGQLDDGGARVAWSVGGPGGARDDLRRSDGSPLPPWLAVAPEPLLGDGAPDGGLGVPAGLPDGSGAPDMADAAPAEARDAHWEHFLQRADTLGYLDVQGLQQLAWDAVQSLSDTHCKVLASVLGHRRSELGMLKSVIDAAFKEARRTVRRDLGTPLQWKDVNEDGRPLETLDNLKALVSVYGWDFRWNEMTHAPELHVDEGQATGPDSGNSAITRVISACRRHGLGTTYTGAYVRDLATEDSYHPLLEAVEGVVWDGQDRIGPLVRTLRVRTSDEGVRASAVVPWLASVWAAAEGTYGVEVPRGVLVLTGPQRIGKTSWLRGLVTRLVPEGFREGFLLDPSNKDSVIEGTSTLVVELGELGQTLRRANPEALKAFLSKPRDTVRVPYARDHRTTERRTVFGATVNDGEFLVDEENTRFWVVPITGVDFETYNGLDWLQLWAQVRDWVGQERAQGRYPWVPTVEQYALLEGRNRDEHRRMGDVERRLLDAFEWQDELPPGGYTTRMTWSQIADLVGVRGGQRGSDADTLRVALRRLTGMTKPARTAAHRYYRVPQRRMPEDFEGDK